MPDRTLTIVFRNPHPQRSPVRAGLYLLRRDNGSSVHINNANQSEFSIRGIDRAACLPRNAVSTSRCLLVTFVSKTSQGAELKGIGGDYGRNRCFD